jgi:hypothetical protein
VFFVRVADKGLMLDAASRTARRFKVDPSTALPSQLRVNRASSSKLKGEEEEANSRQLTVESSKAEGQRKRSEKDNAETRRAQRWR